MSLPAGPWARLLIYSFNDDKTWVNTLWFHPTSSLPGNFDVQLAANDFSSALISAFANPLQAVIAGVKGMRLYVNNGTYTVSADSISGQLGNEVSAEIPTEICAIVQVRTNDHGASGRGRIFLSGVCKDNTSISDLSPAGITLYQHIVTALTTTITAGTVPWVTALYSRRLGTIKPATFIRLDRELGQQRKRKPIF